MKLKLIIATIVITVSATALSKTAFAVTTTVRPNVASRAAALKNVIALATALNGTITSIGTNSFVVNNVTVNLTSSTRLLRRFGAKSSLSEFSIGDQVQILGKWTDDSKTTINARLVRDSSIQKRFGTFVGTIISTSSTGFSFQPLSRPIQNVTTGPTTRFVDRKGKTLTSSAMAAGNKVMVKGMWDNKLNTITEVAVVRDYSLPATPSATPAATLQKTGTQPQ